MQILLTRESDVPLRQQLAEQIVFLIASGQLRPGEEMPSVRALARRVNVHHNTVSEAYQDLVRRGWVSRRPGSRLIIGTAQAPEPQSPTSLDELINQTIQTARRMGYSLQSLRQCARERLLAEPPDHVLVVEDERGLRDILRHEVRRELGWIAEGCSGEEFAREPGLAIGSQVLAPSHVIDSLRALIPPNRPPIALTFSGAEEHMQRIRALKDPSVVTVASVSASLLKTARSLLAKSIGRKHALQEVLLTGDEPIDLSGTDLVFCDSIAEDRVICQLKIRYPLIPRELIEHIASMLEPDR